MAAQTYHQRIREEKRQGCVRAARALFLAQGYERTSLAEVAKAANLSTATLFKRYPTKAALFAAVVDAFQPAPEPAPAGDAGDAEAVLGALGRAYAAGLADPDMAGIHRLIIAEAGVFPDLGRVLHERADAPVLARIEAVLAEHGAAEPAERAASARAFLAIIAREVLWPALTEPGRRPDPAATEAAVRRATAMVLAAGPAPTSAPISRRSPALESPAVPRRESIARRREAPPREETLSLFAFE